MASGVEEKRKEIDEDDSHKSKRQRLEELAEEAEEGDLVYGGGPMPEIPLRSFKAALADPLPEFRLQPHTETPSERPGVVPDRVDPEPIHGVVKRILDGLPDHLFRLTPIEPQAALPLGSEASSNASGQKWIGDPINQVLAEWPDPFVNRWRIELAPKKADKSESTDGSYNANSSRDVPDWRCHIVFSRDGKIKPQKDTVVDFEGKRWGVFLEGLPRDIVKSGLLKLAEAYKEGTLSEDAASSFEQGCRYLFDDEVDVVVLFTPVVLWVIRCEKRAPRKVTVSEPIIAASRNPSMKEVVFAMVYLEIMKAKERMEGVPVPQWLTKAAMVTMDDLGGSDDEPDFTTGPDPFEDGTEGDQLLRELDDTAPPVHGNSLVRIGRLKGNTVAAKIVTGNKERWIREEIENEARSLEALKPLQGSVIPEKVFAGKINGGKDRLLITKYVEGKRLDRAAVVKENVSAEARRALQEIHNEGYVHGDIMPRNIIVKKTGECVFVDLGRAKRLRKDRQKDAEMAKLNVLLD